MFWTLSVFNQWCLMHAVGIGASIPLAATVVTTVNVLTLLPISINGYGVREGAFAAFLASGGLATLGQALSVSLMLVSQTILWGVVGIICWALPSLRRPERAPMFAISPTSTVPEPAVLQP
jgi:uncharacterized membrane protein YbhN (UPF0104 family)